MSDDLNAVSFPMTADDAKNEFQKETEQIQQKRLKKKKGGGFQSMGFSPNLFKGIMRKGFKVPTPIQRKAVPELLQGHDVVAMARTGSGKTAAFVLPMLEKLKAQHSKNGVRAVVMSPTRELCLQTFRVTKELAKFTDLRICSLVGGTSIEEQFEALSNAPDIIVSTPGRLLHHLLEIKTQDFNLKSIEYLVFDEADRLFEMGFSTQMYEILKHIPDDRQTALFSATMPKVLVEFSRAGLKDPVLIRLDVENSLSENLQIVFFTVRHVEKYGALMYLVKRMISSQQQSLIFAATRYQVEFLHGMLTEANISCTYVYGTMDATARNINLAKFRSKKCSVLVVTDLAARGLDIPLLDNVINFDFPPTPKLFVHRVGRVARAGRTGTAYSFVTPDEMGYMVDLHVFLGYELKGAKASDSKSSSSSSSSSTKQKTTHNEETDEDKQEQEKSQSSSNSRQSDMRVVAERSYKMYNQTRPIPSSASVLRAKQLATSIAIHPIFATPTKSSSVNLLADIESEQAIDQFMQQLHSFRSTQTIFETLESKDNVMRMKRREHDAIIRKQKQQQKKSLDADTASVPSTSSSSSSSSSSLSSVSSPSHAEESDDKDNDDEEEGEEEEEGVLKDDEYHDDEKEDEEKGKKKAASKKSKKETNKQMKKQTQIQQRGDNDNDDDKEKKELESSQATTTSSSFNKAHLSKRQRKLLKQQTTTQSKSQLPPPSQQQQQKQKQVASSSSSKKRKAENPTTKEEEEQEEQQTNDMEEKNEEQEETEEQDQAEEKNEHEDEKEDEESNVEIKDDDEEELVALGDAEALPLSSSSLLSSSSSSSLSSFAAPAKVKRSQLKSFRDEQYFLGTVPTDASRENIFMMSTEKPRSGFEGMTLDLTPDDRDLLLKNRNAKHWDRVHKRFVGASSTKHSPFGNDTSLLKGGKTDSGKRISKDSKSGENLYEKWKKKKKQSIHKPEIETESDDNHMAPSSLSHTGRGGGKGKGKGFGGEMRKQKGSRRGPKEELKTPDEIRRKRQDVQKRKSFLKSKKKKTSHKKS